MERPILLPDVARRSFDVIAAAQKVESIEQLDVVVGAAIRELGFETFVGFEAINAEGKAGVTHLFGKGNDTWAERHRQQNFVRYDPVVREMLRSEEPLFWTDIYQRAEIGVESQLVMNEAADFGMPNGFVTPLHSTDGSIAGVQLTGKHLDPRDADVRSAAFVLSTFYGAIARRLVQEARRKPLIRPLTSRQIECLKWVREGKSSADIGDILNISQHTVIEHVAEACARLGVRTRVQAVAEAALRNIITL